MTLSFEMPWLLVLAVVLPVAAVMLVIRSHRSKKERVARMGTESVVMRLIPVGVVRAPTWRAVRLALAAVLVGIAAASPQWGFERTVVRSNGIDMVLALDASLSMMAPDEHPNRLERMKAEVRRLRDASPGDRVGLLAFAGRSYVLSPLTVDVGALDLFLDNLDPTVVGQAGSSLARTIKQGVELLKLSTSGADRALVVMSDGEAFEPVEEVEAEARAAKEAGVSLVTVGFGTAQGTTIPVVDGATVSLKRDDQGQVVITKYHPEFLQAAATAAGGTFIDAAATDKAGQIKRALATLRTQARSSYSGDNKILRYQWFLLPAMLLLFLDTLVAERNPRRRFEPAAAHTAAALALLLFVLSSCSTFQRNGAAVSAFHSRNFAKAASLFKGAIAAGDQSKQTLYNFGTSLVSADSTASAVEVLQKLITDADPELRYRSAFNLGLAHLKHGLSPNDSAGVNATLDAAIAMYKKVLLMRPQDMDAKWNYELALRKRDESSGGGGSADQSPSPEPKPQPAGGLAQRQAEQLLGSAAREERDTQAQKQKLNKVEPPPGGKSW